MRNQTHNSNFYIIFKTLFILTLFFHGNIATYKFESETVCSIGFCINLSISYFHINMTNAHKSIEKFVPLTFLSYVYTCLCVLVES
jgi:hypothetical protein